MQNKIDFISDEGISLKASNITLPFIEKMPSLINFLMKGIFLGLYNCSFTGSNILINDSLARSKEGPLSSPLL
jgi:hypothetical protein